MEKVRLFREYKGLYFDDLKEGDVFMVVEEGRDSNGPEIIYIKKCSKGGSNAIGVSFKGKLHTFNYFWGTNPKVVKIKEVTASASEE